jgi:hypothetical protein
MVGCYCSSSLRVNLVKSSGVCRVFVISMYNVAKQMAAHWVKSDWLHSGLGSDKYLRMCAIGRFKVKSGWAASPAAIAFWLEPHLRLLHPANSACHSTYTKQHRTRRSALTTFPISCASSPRDSTHLKILVY